MKRSVLMLGAACLLCGGASAGNFDGILSGGYTYTGIEGASANTYDFGAIAKYKFNDSGYAIQGNFDYSHMDLEGFGFDTIKVGGAGVWRDDRFAVGVYGEYNNLKTPGDMSLNYESFGLVGEWYAMPNLTVRAHIGELHADGADGVFGGGGVSYYVMPDLSLNLDGSYNNIDSLHWTNLKVGAEYLISHEYPVTIGVNYVYTNYGSDLDSNAVMVRLTWRLGDSGSLVDLDRSGPLNLQLPNLELL